ncbi:hypothetical protein FKP32DRAFT_1603723 [Trametes sanguinea]|nr:hypothetical protein FKP32DRAFT_1603723 [Trametes sanguinea]
MSSNRATRLSTASTDRAAKRQKTTDGEDTSANTSSDTAPSSSPTATTPPHPSATTTTSERAPSSSVDDHARILAKIRKPEWMTDDALSRIADFLAFAEPSTNRYSVSRVPVLATWGHTSDLARYLCNNNRPVIIWHVGTLETKWFQNHSGDPQDVVNIGILPLTEQDQRAVAALLSKNLPRKAPEGNKVYARRRMTEWVPGELKPTIHMFDRIYDATNGFGRKETLPKLYPADLSIGDVVLVETVLTRYKTGTVKYRWEAWNTSFDLQSVSLLAKAPRSTEDTQPYFGDDESDLRFLRHFFIRLPRLTFVFTMITLCEDSVVDAILDNLDFPTLMNMRAVDKRLLAHITSYLREQFNRILEGVVPDVEMLLYAMERHNVYVAGMSILPYFLRDAYVPSYPLQFVVPEHAYHSFVDHLRSVQDATSETVITPSTSELGFRSMLTMSGTTRNIMVIRSLNESSLTPIIRGSNTAVMCYVGPTHFGVLWPSLTFSRKALLGDRSPSEKRTSAMTLIAARAITSAVRRNHATSSTEVRCMRLGNPYDPPPFNQISTSALMTDPGERVDDPKKIALAVAIEPASLTRLQRLLDFTDPSEGHFALARMPIDAIWDDTWDTPALATGRRPIRFRVVVTDAYIVDRGPNQIKLSLAEYIPGDIVLAECACLSEAEGDDRKPRFELLAIHRIYAVRHHNGIPVSP